MLKKGKHNLFDRKLSAKTINYETKSQTVNIDFMKLYHR